METIPAFFADTIARRGDELALGVIQNRQLRWRTWREVAQDAAQLAITIRDAGIEVGDRVVQVCENRYEWIVTDLALHTIGAVHVPIHVTLSGEQIAEQIADCGARLVLASSEELQARFGDLLANDVAVWVHDEITRAKRQAVGELPSPDIDGEQLATILYTSGTTGRPRGVMLTQRNLASNAAAVADSHGGGADQTRLCILPLSHVFARTCDLYTWLYLGSRLVLGEGRDTLERDCELARPNGLSAVPYVYQRIMEQIQSGDAWNEAAALQAYFGGAMERPACGGAPLAPETEHWYAERGLPILPGYGLTETSPVVAKSSLEQRRFGSVGQLLADVEVQIAGDGEVLVRGPNVMSGYWRDETATAEALRDGWLHTGDLGSLDANRFLYIRGRKKDMIPLSTGKKVCAARVEALLTASPLIEQAAVFGEGRPALVALIVPAARATAIDGEAPLRAGIAAEIGRRLRSAAREEQVRHFAILDRMFLLERGELTAKMSLCRDVIARHFAEELTSCMVAGDAVVGSADAVGIAGEASN